LAETKCFEAEKSLYFIHISGWSGPSGRFVSGVGKNGNELEGKLKKGTKFVVVLPLKNEVEVTLVWI